MKLQRLLSLTRKAIDDYNLIEEGDRIAVGVSGGKDSLTLLYALKHLQRFYPKHFELEAVTVNLGFEAIQFSAIADLCQTLKVPYHIIDTRIAQIIFEERKESSPCALCAKMRKGALNDAVKRLNCNKVAYAHHRDDMIETMLLSMIYEGRFYSFSPKTYLQRSDLTVIRPLMYVQEADVKGFQNRYQLPVVINPCPMDKATKREYVKQLLRQINIENPGAKTRMFHAIIDGNIDGWPDKISHERNMEENIQ